MLTESEERLQASFRLGLHPETNPLLAAVVGEERAFWIRTDSAPEDRKLVRGPFAQFVGKAGFLIHPVIFSGKCIGFRYADHANSERLIKASDEVSFRQFVRQFNSLSRVTLREASFLWID